MSIDQINEGEYRLSGLSKIDVLLGKNGCGKSSLLKEIDRLTRNKDGYGTVKYITPERGGVLKENPGIASSIAGNEQWLPETRRTNRFESFREQSIAQFKTLELLFLREMEATPILRQDLNHEFAAYFNKINKLLDNIELKRFESRFKIYKKGTSDEIKPEFISSGESELISLGIECLVFDQQCVKGKSNVLLLDEPDVHLHPDLQARLCYFLKELVNKGNATIIVATHSTAFLGALEDFPEARIAFMHSGQTNLKFVKISDEYRKILPVFGASPLSNIFNKTPVFLVEGDDDERIWQQAVRRSGNKLKIYPCSANGIGNMPRYEKDVESIITSVYDGAKAYSLRDKDVGDTSINALKIIERFKLHCRASENLLLTDEVLSSLGTRWGDFKSKLDDWIAINMHHPHHEIFLSFQRGGYDRKDFDLKNIRNDLIHLLGSNLTWESAVGKVIGHSFKENNFDYSEGGLGNYLGKNFVNTLLSK